jgi:hypothetical protein
MDDFHFFTPGWTLLKRVLRPKARAKPEFLPLHFWGSHSESFFEHAIDRGPANPQF